jgi:hypothetical protein
MDAVLTSSQVKDNKEELSRLSMRLQYLISSLEESRARDILNSTEYEDALSTVFAYVEPR